VEEVNIYIDATHTGHLKKGTGTYSIVLEYIKPDGTPRTKEYIQGLKHTTKNRTALQACIDALSHLIKICSVIIFINSAYITQALNEKWIESWNSSGWITKGKPVKNKDLWQQLLLIMDKHDIKCTFIEINPYTSYMRTMAKKIEINYKEDEQNV